MLEDVFEVMCPYCGEQVELIVEADVFGEMVQDCEVCCSPIQITVRRDDWGDPDIQVAKTDS